MKSTITFALALFAISTLFYNCSPVPITRVNLAKDDVGYWQKGTAIGEKVADSILVEAVFSHVDDKYIYFDIGIENIGADRALIDPKKIKLVDPVNGGILKAIDPELMVLNMELRDSKRTANNKTLAIVAGAAIVAGTVAAVAATDGDAGSGGDSSEDDDDIYVDTYLFTDLTPGNMAPMNYQYFSQEPLLSTDIRTLPNPDRVEFWREFAFRKSTLFPKQRMRGLIVFMKSKFMKRSQLIIPSISKDLTFDFVHFEYKP